MPIIKQWADSSSSWKCKSALYVYSNIKYEERDAEFDNKVRKSIINLYSMIERDDWRKENMTYIRILLISFERTRTLISEVLNEWINNKGFLLNNEETFDNQVYGLIICTVIKINK